MERLKMMEERVEEAVERARRAGESEKKWKEKYWAARRRLIRVLSVQGKTKMSLKEAKSSAYQLQSSLVIMEKNCDEIQRTSNTVVEHLQERIASLEDTERCLNKARANERKKNKYLQKMYAALRLRQQAFSRHHPFQLVKKGVYTQQARALARYLVSTGTAEKKIGAAIKTVGMAFGVNIKRTMSARTVKRTVLEGGVAADIQLAYEIEKSDSKPKVSPTMRSMGTDLIK